VKQLLKKPAPLLIGFWLRNESRNVMMEGLPPNNAAHVMRLVTDRARATRLVDVIGEIFDPAESAASAFEIEDAPEAPKPWLVEVYFADAPDEAAILDIVRMTTDAPTASVARFETILAKDWVEASLAGLPPVRAGRFIVHGAHDRKTVKNNEIGIEIEAALAFGTGHHGTTRGCLLLLDAELKRRRPIRILDVGTGTGVLAIAAARALHQRVEAGDIDPVATETAHHNARFNQAGAYVKPVTARGLEHPVLAAGGPYDLILANILQKPLMRLAPSIARAAASSATLVLSGLLAPDVAGVVSAYRSQGFHLDRRINLEGWAALLMRR
jgi:ribosomal protein L11 methyltransferase